MIAYAIKTEIDVYFPRREFITLELDPGRIHADWAARPRPRLVLDDAQEDLLRQIARGRSHGFTLAETDIADELGQLDLVVIGARGHWLATPKGFRAVGLRRLVPAPGRHRVARKAVRRG